MLYNQQKIITLQGIDTQMSNTPYTTPQADVTPDTNTDQTYNPKLFSMKGRIGRVRYLAYSFLAFFILYISFAIIFGILTAIFVNSGAGFGDFGSNPALILPIGIFYIAFTFLYWVLLIRRLNDMNMTGWLSLLMLIPLVNVILGLVLIFYPGTKGSNKYGPQQIKNSIWIWIGGLMAPLIFIGVLAAVSIPAYQDYVKRAQLAEQQLGR